MAFETITAPIGAYISWASIPGQIIEGIITDYDPIGATSINDDTQRNPLISIRLTQPAYSLNSRGERRDFQTGEEVLISCGQAQLRSLVKAAQLQAGQGIRVTLTGTEKTSKGGTMKTFTLEVDRTPTVTPAPVADTSSRPF